MQSQWECLRKFLVAKYRMQALVVVAVVLAVVGVTVHIKRHFRWEPPRVEDGKRKGGAQRRQIAPREEHVKQATPRLAHAKPDKAGLRNVGGRREA